MKKIHNNNRSEKIASGVQRAVAEILRDRGVPVTITGAVTSGGLSFVRLFWQGDRALQPALDKMTAAVRMELAEKIDQKYVPDIRFSYDDTLEKSRRIDELLENIKKEIK
ncbi:MAG: ribosome-binding factor A [Rickettsiales bacterium]|jgi:ribosome-binding factor A|nr:ribosome-binding factor A [Rickettsiales bacterium]